jgi:hypothetical protein
MKNLETMNNFTLKNIPNLNEVILAALELFENGGVPKLNLGKYKKPLVIGSVNAFFTGKILFVNSSAVFANESDYKNKIKTNPDIDGCILISASGAKHAIPMAKFLKTKNIETRLLTNNPDAPAKKYIDDNKFFVFPKNREPYTYNTSTYLGMILGKTKENPKLIKEFILKRIKPILDKKKIKYDSYYLIIPNEFDSIRDMFLTKFDELLQPAVSGRCFTVDQSMHAKNVVVSDKELFISFGYANEDYGLKNNRLHIPLPDKADFGALMAIGYYVIGKIQNSQPPYFQQNIKNYMKRTSKIFGKEMKAIVE